MWSLTARIINTTNYKAMCTTVMQWVLSYSLDTQVSSTILDYGSLGTGNFLWHRRIYPKSDKQLWIVIWFMLNLTNFDRPNRNFITELTIWSNNLWLSYQKVVFIYPSLIIFVLEFHGYIFWISYGPYPDFLYLFSTLFSRCAPRDLKLWSFLSKNFILTTKSNYLI